METITLTAATLRAILCFIANGVTPAIAYDRDDLAEPLGNKLKEAVGDKHGSQTVYIRFGPDEKELHRQFKGVCKNISGIFDFLSDDFRL